MRGRKVRFGAADGGDEPAEPVTVIGPVVFTVVFGGAGVTTDLSDLPCPRLVRPLAAALASVSGDHGTVRTVGSFRQMVRHLREFACFTAGYLDCASDDAGLREVRPGLLDGFEAALIGRFGTAGARVQLFMSTVVRLLRLAEQAAPGTLTPAAQARLSYAASVPARRRTPLNAYPEHVLEAIQQAALADARMLREQAGAGTTLHLSAAQAVPLLVALICLTGLEPECAKGLRASCLSSPSGGFVTLAYTKKRAHTRTSKTMRIRSGGITTPAGLITLVATLTGPARQATGSDALWAGAGHDGLRVWFDTGYRSFSQYVQAWASRHGLDQLDDYGGGKARLDLRRIRKSVKSRRYLQTGGILGDFTAGHTKAVAAAHYADIGAHDAVHDQAVEDGLRQALHAVLPDPVTATPDGKPLNVPGGTALLLTPAQRHAAASSEQDVFLASCTGFRSSPFARTAGDGCPVAAWGCLECPNAVFTERHLPSLIAFAAFTEAQREALDSAQWQARYGTAHHRLTTGIFPAFTPAQHAAARHDDTGVVSLPVRLLESLT